MPNIEIRPVSVKLENGFYGRIKKLAETRKRTAHWVMREAISQYLEREEKREKFRREALNAWQEYELTGLHLTADEADEWLGKLEAGQDVEIPPCHS